METLIQRALNGNIDTWVLFSVTLKIGNVKRALTFVDNCHESVTCIKLKKNAKKIQKFNGKIVQTIHYIHVGVDGHTRSGHYSYTCI